MQIYYANRGLGGRFFFLILFCFFFLITFLLNPEPKGIGGMYSVRNVLLRIGPGKARVGGTTFFDEYIRRHV